MLPKIFPFSFGEDPSHIDSFVTVQCAATVGDLPIDIEWLHDGQLVSRSNDYGISIVHSGRRVSTLTIESIRDHHAGNYTCRAKNQAGTVEQSTQLIINGLWRDFAPVSYAFPPSFIYFYLSLHLLLGPGAGQFLPKYSPSVLAMIR